MNPLKGPWRSPEPTLRTIALDYTAAIVSATKTKKFHTLTVFLASTPHLQVVVGSYFNNTLR